VNELRRFQESLSKLEVLVSQAPEVLEKLLLKEVGVEDGFVRLNSLIDEFIDLREIGLQEGEEGLAHLNNKFFHGFILVLRLLCTCL